MTARIYPAPQTPGYVYLAREGDDCEVCGNDELMAVCRPGLPVGDIGRCPACTRTGAREVAELVRLGGGAA